MNRRSNEQRGYVNFPTKNSRYKSSGEGGMFVYLVVVEEWEEAGSDDGWAVCCTNDVVIPLSDCVVGDDQIPNPPEPDWAAMGGAEETNRALREHENLRPQGHHYPGVQSEEEGRQKYDSIPYLAAICLGTTGWSGWDEEAGEYWKCTFDDLTRDGQMLHHLVQKLYQGVGPKQKCRAKLHLVTFLDT